MKYFQDRLGELVEMITVRREGFCQDSLGQTFAYLDAYHSSSSYEAILPAQALALTEANDWQTKVAVAYDTFQRIALGLEVVRTDLEHHEDGSESVNQLWPPAWCTLAALPSRRSRSRSSCQSDSGMIARN